MENHFTCEHCRRKRSVDKKENGIIKIANEQLDYDLSHHIEEFLSNSSITKYRVDENEITLPVCHVCIKESNDSRRSFILWGFFGSIFLFLLQIFIGWNWFLLAASSILFLATIRYWTETKKRSSSTADRLAVIVMQRKMAREMQKNPSLRFLTRDEYDRLTNY